MVSEQKNKVEKTDGAGFWDQFAMGRDELND